MRKKFNYGIDLEKSKNPFFESLYTAMAWWGGEGDARIVLSAPRNPRIVSFRAVDGQLAAPLRASAG
jgi:predicted nicotinamide N-methyase